MRCLYCLGEVSSEASKCQHCGEWLKKKPGRSPVVYVARAGLLLMILGYLVTPAPVLLVAMLCGVGIWLMVELINWPSAPPGTVPRPHE